MPIGVVLLVSRDKEAIDELGAALRQLSLVPDLCADPSSATSLLNRRKYDAIMVDLLIGKDAEMLLNVARRSASNGKAVTFALSADTDNQDSPNQANFTFVRPLSTRSIHSTLRAAYGLILRERRRYFRCPVYIPVIVHRIEAADVHCYAQNLSEGGMALSTFIAFTQGEEVRVDFTIPELGTLVSAESEICWWRTGHLGLRFKSLSEQSRIDLQRWLARKLEEMLPDFVSRAFEKPMDPSILNS